MILLKILILAVALDQKKKSTSKISPSADYIYHLSNLF